MQLWSEWCLYGVLQEAISWELEDEKVSVKDSIKSSGKDLWQTVFAECDFTSVKDGTFPQAFSYEKDGDIYLIVPVSHAAGDYALVKYSPETK